MDTEAFNSCLESGEYRELVQEELAEARERGVRSTPTLFINGERVEGALPFAELQAIIEAELAD